MIKDILKIICGNLLLTFAYAFLTVPNHIINGGITSTCLLLSSYLHVEIPLFSNSFTVILLLLSLLFLGKTFFLRSILSSLCYMIFFTFFHTLPLHISLPVLPCILAAGILVGSGYYLCISANSSTVGYDVIALIINKKNPKLEVADTLRYISFLILISGLFTFGISSVLLGILFTFIETEILKLLRKRKCRSTSRFSTYGHMKGEKAHETDIKSI